MQRTIDPLRPQVMTQTKGAAEMSMSLDGFVADENAGTNDLFGWSTATSRCRPAISRIPPIRLSGPAIRQGAGVTHPTYRIL
jgi:hypothetical protein